MAATLGPQLARGSLWIDCTSGEPAATRALAEEVLRPAGVDLIDSPVSGGPAGAVSGQLTAMVGGSPAAAPLPPVLCKICYEESADYSALSCGHAFCNKCYSTFMTHKVTDEGHDCFFARCPEPKCGLVVSSRLAHALLDHLSTRGRARSVSSGKACLGGGVGTVKVGRKRCGGAGTVRGMGRKRWAPWQCGRPKH